MSRGLAGLGLAKGPHHKLHRTYRIYATMSTNHLPASAPVMEKTSFYLEATQTGAEKEGRCGFMALPVELRCSIYGYLPQLVYKSVFPKIDRSLVGTCCWPIYRMPTPLLQLSKIVHLEVKDFITHAAFKQKNDQMLPNIIMGPYFAKEPIFDPLTTPFTIVDDSQTSEYLINPQSRINSISDQLADWYNNNLRHTFREEIHDKSNVPCSPASVHPFVVHTLKRMEFHHTTAPHVRVLFRGSRLPGNSYAEFSFLTRLRTFIPRSPTADLSPDRTRRFFDISTIVIPQHTDAVYTNKVFIDRMLEYLRGHRNEACIKIETATAQDQWFFDQDCSLDHPYEERIIGHE